MGGNSCLLPLLFEEKRFFAWPLESSEGTTLPSPQSRPQSQTSRLSFAKRLALGEHLLRFLQQMPSAGSLVIVSTVNLNGKLRE